MIRQKNHPPSPDRWIEYSVYMNGTSLRLVLHPFRCCGCCAGCVFNSLLGWPDSANAIQVFDAPAVFDSCTFRSLSMAPDPGPLEAGERIEAAIQAQGLNSTLALRNCTIQNTQSSFDIGLYNADFYSDNAVFRVLPPLHLPCSIHTPCLSYALVAVSYTSYSWLLYNTYTQLAPTAS